jgi:hypothetical protein
MANVYYVTEKANLKPEIDNVRPALQVAGSAIAVNTVLSV